MRSFLKQNWRFLGVVGGIGLALRLACVYLAPMLTLDTWYYGQLAKNWLQHGILGVWIDHQLVPTYVRLPGYPGFLAAVFAIFGAEHYRAVLVLQAFFDLGTCLLVADLTRRTVGLPRVPHICPGLADVGDENSHIGEKRANAGHSHRRAARWAFALTALCPFLIDYVAAGLTETLAVFFTVLTLDLAVAAMDSAPIPGKTRSFGKYWQALKLWAACGAALACGILLRPDGGILLAALLLYLAICAARLPNQRAHFFAAGAVMTAVALAPLAPWTLRNWRDFHRFQPLAPRYANAADEYAPVGFERWTRTWIADYVSVSNFYWNFNGEPADASVLPNRAFDSPEQRLQTQQLIDRYNHTPFIKPELDTQFAQLAAARIRHAPLRYYIGLPLLRIADMWLRPRTEMMPFDERWWRYDLDKPGAVLSAILAALNLAYLIAAGAGFLRGRPRYAGMLLVFVLLRTAFLGTLENPETRYTLECYPVVLVGASTALARWRRHTTG